MNAVSAAQVALSKYTGMRTQTHTILY